MRHNTELIFETGTSQYKELQASVNSGYGMKYGLTHLRGVYVSSSCQTTISIACVYMPRSAPLKSLNK